jgi:hypothetical protein
LGWVAQAADAVRFLRGIDLDAGVTYTLSAYMKADRPRLDVFMGACGYPGSIPVSY